METGRQPAQGSVDQEGESGHVPGLLAGLFQLHEQLRNQSAPQLAHLRVRVLTCQAATALGNKVDEQRKDDGHQCLAAHVEAELGLAQVLEQIEGNGAVFHFLGQMPFEQVYHGRVAVLLPGVVVHGPLTQHASEVFDGRDQPHTQYQPLLLNRLALQECEPERCLPQKSAKQPFHPLHVLIHAQSMALQIKLGLAVGPGMHGLLADKPFHVGAQLIITDQRQGLVVDPAEP